MKNQEPVLRAGFTTADKLVRQTTSTGIPTLDDLLGGGLESGLTHLFYGARCLHDDLLKIAVHFQRSKKEGGLESPAIIIDSTNMLKIDRLTDYSYEFKLEPEEVMDNIYISRAFNSSQTYDLIMNQLESFFERIDAKLLIVSGLPNLYISEGVTSEGLQEITHMATKLMTFTLNRRIYSIVSAPSSERSDRTPSGGKALASCAQVHIHVEESKSFIKYTLAKHPQYPVKRASRMKPIAFGTTLPLSYFLGDGEEEE